MADPDFDDYEEDYGAAEGPRPRSVNATRLINLAGAVSSIAIVIGVGIWGYNLAMRDVNGIPVIRAMEGPMRIAPANPGGEVAAHQGLAVNDVAAVGAAAPPPEQLVLAPRPVELTAEDAAAEDLNGAAPDVARQDTALAPVIAPTAPLATEESTGADPDAVAKALAEALATDPDAAPIEEEGVAEDPLLAADVPAEAGEEVQVASAAIPSTRPQARPASIATAAPATAATDTAPALAVEDPVAPAPVEVAASSIPNGTRLVQLGAFDTEDQARGEWTRLTNQFGPVFAGKAMVVQSAESGGRTFYRLRAHGFADETEARAFCLSLLEQNASCIPVEQR